MPSFPDTSTTTNPPPSRDMAVSALGGGPPVGWGIHEKEQHFWEEPIYRVHPLTQRLEAVEGLFLRMWPEHVQMLLQMKADGWGHEEILDVAEELKGVQEQVNEQNKKLLEGARAGRSQNEQEQVSQAQGRMNPPDAIMPPGSISAPGGETGFGKALYKSILRLEDLDKRAERINSDTPHAVPRLPFALNALEPVISKEAMQLHYGVLHRSYVDKLNRLVKGTPWRGWTPITLLKRIRELPEQLRLDIEHEAGGHTNHTILWNTLQAPTENNSPGGDLMVEFNLAFGSFVKFKKHCTALLQYFKGSGWLWLVFCQQTGGLQLRTFSNQQNPWSRTVDDIPLLGIDVWEHAFLLDYGADREAYLDGFWKLINWEVVWKRWFWAHAAYHNGGSGEELSKLDTRSLVDPELHKADPAVAGTRRLTPQQSKVQREQNFTREPQGVAQGTGSEPSPVDTQEEQPPTILVFEPATKAMTES